MSIFKRGRIYSFHFYFSGRHVQRSTRQTSAVVARQMEAACRTALAKGELGIFERQAVPSLKEFAQRFMDFISVRCAEKPNTIRFYSSKLKRLLDSKLLRDKPIDQIDEQVIERYIQQRRQQLSRLKRQLSPATV